MRASWAKRLSRSKPHSAWWTPAPTLANFATTNLELAKTSPKSPASRIVSQRLTNWATPHSNDCACCLNYLKSKSIEKINYLKNCSISLLRHIFYGLDPRLRLKLKVVILLQNLSLDCWIAPVSWRLRLWCDWHAIWQSLTRWVSTWLPCHFKRRLLLLGHTCFGSGF